MSGRDWSLDIRVWCQSDRHPGKRSFVAGFGFVAENDTPELRRAGAHWGVPGGQDIFYLHENNIPRLRLACRKCDHPVINQRLNKLTPVLDWLRASGREEIDLAEFAAIVDSSNRLRSN